MRILISSPPPILPTPTPRSTSAHLHPPQPQQCSPINNYSLGFWSLSTTWFLSTFFAQYKTQNQFTAGGGGLRLDNDGWIIHCRHVGALSEPCHKLPSPRDQMVNSKNRKLRLNFIKPQHTHIITISRKIGGLWRDTSHTCNHFRTPISSRLWDSGDGHSFQMNFNRIIKCETHLPPITSQQTLQTFGVSWEWGRRKARLTLQKHECESLMFLPSDILIVHFRAIATELQSSIRGGANWPGDKMELKPRHFVIVCGARTLLFREMFLLKSSF